MIYCLNCGKGIPDQSKFCTFCGTPIKTADVQPEVTTPPVSEQYTNPTPPEQEYTNPTPTPQEYTNPTPPSQQQYVPPTPPPIPQQYSNTPPPPPPQYSSTPAPQYSNPTQPTVQQFATKSEVVTKNEFYKNIGFWGAVLTLIGFFLPYINGYDFSFYYLVTDLAPDKPELYLYAIFPVSAAILILQGFTGILPKFLVAIFKILPLLMLILFVIGITNNSSDFGFMGNDVGSVLSNIGVGLYMTVIGTLLMLFFRTTKRKI